MVKEIWKDIDGYDGIYKISNMGRVKSLAKNVNMPNGGTRLDCERIIKGSVAPNGYRRINLSKNGRVITHSIHRLVLESFDINVDNKPYVNHKDGNKLNNRLSNLEWVTGSENILHSLYELGNISKLNKNKRVLVQILDDEKKVIREHLGIRNCAKIEKISTKTIYEYNDSGKIYRGYYWRVIK